MKTLIAAIARNGVIGRTTKPCEECDGIGLVDNAPAPEGCEACEGEGEIPSNDLPWPPRTYPEDMARFKARTVGNPIIMGARTWESFPRRPLPDRDNIVVSRSFALQTNPGVPRTWFVPDLESALWVARDAADVFFIGGVRIFRAALPIVDVLDLTLIGRDYDGDVLFPEGATLHRRTAIAYTHNDGRTLHAFDLVERNVCPTNPDLTFTRWNRRR